MAWRAAHVEDFLHFSFRKLLQCEITRHTRQKCFADFVGVKTYPWLAGRITTVGSIWQENDLISASSSPPHTWSFRVARHCSMFIEIKQVAAKQSNYDQGFGHNFLARLSRLVWFTDSDCHLASAECPTHDGQHQVMFPNPLVNQVSWGTWLANTQPAPFPHPWPRTQQFIKEICSKREQWDSFCISLTDAEGIRNQESEG